MEQIQQTNSISELQKLVEATVERITVHTIDKSINFVVITYLNGKSDYFIYSVRLLKHIYILIPQYQEGDDPRYKYNSLEFDSSNKQLLIPDDAVIVFENMSETGRKVKWLTPIFFNTEENANCKEQAIETARLHNIKVYERAIDIRTFTIGCKGTFLCHEFDPSPFIEDDERREIQAKREKEYQARRNNGLPTTLPYVVRDSNYEEYTKQRKHLYNRRYKIRKHKRLSDGEKQKLLKEIDKQLALLRAKVKYLSREEAIIQFQKE